MASKQSAFQTPYFFILKNILTTFYKGLPIDLSRFAHALKVLLIFPQAYLFYV